MYFKTNSIIWKYNDYNYLTQSNENISYLELDLFPLVNDIVFLPDIIMIFAKEHFNNGNE